MAFIAPAVMGALALYKAYQDSQNASDSQNRVNAASANQLHNTDTAWRTIQLKRQEDANAMMGNLSRQMNSYGGAASVLSNMYGGQGSAPVGTGLPPPMLQGLHGPIGGPQMAPQGAQGLPGVNIAGGPAAMRPPMSPASLPGVNMMGGPGPTNQMGMGMPMRPPMTMGAGPDGAGIQSLASLMGRGGFGGLTGGPGPVGGF